MRCTTSLNDRPLPFLFPERPDEPLAANQLRQENPNELKRKWATDTIIADLQLVSRTKPQRENNNRRRNVSSREHKRPVLCCRRAQGTIWIVSPWKRILSRPVRGKCGNADNSERFELRSVVTVHGHDVLSPYHNE